MIPALAQPLQTSEHGWLLALALMLPMVGAILAFLLASMGADRWGARIGAASAAAGLAVAFAIAALLLKTGSPLVLHVGGWVPPLGIALRADGISAAFLLTAAAILCATTSFAWRDFQTHPGQPPSRRAAAFWPLLLGAWGGLVTVLLANDLFTFFVALELLTFAAVPLVSLDGRERTIAAALRYLLFALLGSMLYLLGVALVYGAFGTLDLTLLSGRLTSQPAGIAALALMTTGLLAKAAVFPFHLWLPPAHAGAPPAASAVLSALVVKGPFVLAVRLWFELAPNLLGGPATQCLAALGAMAILFGSVMAVRAPRLKMLVAYSTVAQIGYLFLAFALTFGPDTIGTLTTGTSSMAAAEPRVLSAAVLQAVSHAFAKAAMFFAVGMIAEFLGHDRVAGLGGLGRTMPLTVATLLIAGLSLMGVPPSGGFWAKWLLLTAATETGQWWWTLVMLSGGLLAGGYVLRMVAPALLEAPPNEVPTGVPVAMTRQWSAFILAMVSLLLGLLAVASVDLIEVGRWTALADGPGRVAGGGP